MESKKIKELNVNTLRLSEPLNIGELEGVLKTLTNKVNEVVRQANEQIETEEEVPSNPSLTIVRPNGEKMVIGPSAD